MKRMPTLVSISERALSRIGYETPPPGSPVGVIALGLIAELATFLHEASDATGSTGPSVFNQSQVLATPLDAKGDGSYRGHDGATTEADELAYLRQRCSNLKALVLELLPFAKVAASGITLRPDASCIRDAELICDRVKALKL